MAKDKTYTQCSLKKGKCVDVAWIPTKFAKVGQFIKIKEIDGWEVISVGNVKPIDEVRDFEREYLKARDRTDQ